MSRIDSQALVVRTVDVGESDVIATLVTEQVGKVSAIVRGARRGSRRIGGALEPVHTVAVMLEDRGVELTTMKEARIVRTRPRLVESLDALEAAGVALRWARHLFPPRTPEPQGWHALITLLDVLDAGGASPKTELARVGLALLAAVGYGLELEQCVVCARPCPEGKTAQVDPGRGGLVCRSCGGASVIVSAAVRATAAALVDGSRGDTETDVRPVRLVNEADARVLLELVDRSMAAHAGFER